MTTTTHPLDPLTPEEITTTSNIIKSTYPTKRYIFNSITLLEPPKSTIQSTPESEYSNIPRKSFTILITPEDSTTHECITNLTTSTIESYTPQPPTSQPTLSPEDCFEAERICKESEQVKARAESLGLDISNVVADPWSVGYNGEEEYKGKRLVQLFMYFKNFEGDNHYAHPLDFVVVVDIINKKIVSIQDLPSHSSFTPETPPASLQKDPSNYDPDIIPHECMRKGLKPLEIEQPEGPSFTVRGNEVDWQNFKIRVGFNYREGLVLHDVRYVDGATTRPLFYRMSLSEMVVPYGDPRPPYHRKCAYDIGDYGLGFCTNNLTLGCDCLGTIKYFPGVLNNHAGQPVTIPRAICLHEEDSGLLQKHTEYRNNHVVVARGRRLVLSFIATVVNYEYAFYWYFYLDGSIGFEVKPTGELSTNLIDKGVVDPEYGTIVFPGVLAQSHQHIFCVRLDANVDGGDTNVLSEVDVEGLGGRDDNPHGQGFKVIEKVVDGWSDVKGLRSWRISNPGSLHPYTNKPVGWKLIPSYNWGNGLIAREGSWIRERARFATHSVWGTRFKEGRVFAGGFYINQSIRAGGVVDWVEEDKTDAGEGEGLIVWHSFGVTHVPRVEDFPIMPVDSTGFMLKPNNFFKQNPAVGVGPTNSCKSRAC